MTEITNNTASTIYIGSVKLAPNGSADVPNFDIIKTSGAIPTWLSEGVISEPKPKKVKAKKAKPEPVKTEAFIKDIEKGLAD